MERRFDNNDSDSSFSRRENYDRYDSARRDGSRDGSSRYNRSYNREGDSYGSRPRFNREGNDGEQRPRFSRPRYNSDNDGEQRPRYNRDNDGEQRPRYNRDNDGSYSSRPRYNSDNNGEQRPRFNRDNNRSGYSSRPRYNSDNDGEQRNRFSRPRYNSDNDGEQRPRYNREGGYNSSRPRYNSDNNDGERRPSFGNRSRYNSDNNGEQKPRYNREGGNSRPRNNNRGGFKGNRGGGYSESRPRFNKERGFHNYDREELQRKSSITEDLFTSDDAIMAAGEEIASTTSNKMRLNRYIAMAGVCSRREADELIKAGKIRLNGNVITEMGVTVQKGDVVEYEGRKLAAERKVYVLLNKPKDVITTTDDPEERRTIIDLVEGACDERIYPVGRLDRNTTGVILLTNDGEMTEKLMHPKYGVRKIYHVFLDKNVTEDDMRKMAEGVTLEDGPIAVDDVRYVDNSDKKQVGVQIHSGRNRIVRRIFEHLGYNVERLDRVYFAGLTKLNLPRGKWRFLTDTEVNKLKAGFYK